ncbi:MAG: DUF3226 domain-containing protein [Caldilineaceae bacterium]
MVNKAPRSNRQNRPTEITKPKLLLGEGNDEVEFFNALLAHLQLEDVQVVDYLGKHNVFVELATVLKLPGFSQLESIGITRDADYFDNVADWLVPENRSVGEATAALYHPGDTICTPYL